MDDLYYNVIEYLKATALTVNVLFMAYFIIKVSKSKREKISYYITIGYVLIMSILILL